MVTCPSAATKKVLERLDELYAIGGGPGANRPGLSREEERAHELVAGWMEAAGLEVSADPAGNLVGRLGGRRRELPEVWTGSHLDSVPAGGRFDGTLGVVAGLAAVEQLAASGRTERTVAVVAFRDEEGWRFGRGCFGSRALCGQLAGEELETTDAGGVTAREALTALGLPAPPLDGWLGRTPGVFVEAHVEQGPRLERAGAPLAVVTGIVGLARYVAEFRGEPGHAGTTPMSERADALWPAAELVLRVRDAASALDGAVATVGALEVEPGAANVIPARVSLTVDARAPDGSTLDALLAAIAEAAAAGTLTQLRRSEPVAMAAAPMAALRRELERLALPVVELPSGAGHDAGVLAAAGVPSAMLFVRSLAGGASHSPQELTSDEDVGLCIEVLAGALGALASH